MLPAYSQDSAMNYYADGMEALDMKDYEGALCSFEKAVRMDPENLEFQYLVGVTYVRIKRNEEALEIFESLISKDPKNYLKAYYDISAIYSGQKNYKKALDTLNLAGKIDPESARVYLEKGYAYKNLKDYDRAIESFERARELDPKLTQLAIFMIGATYLEAEKFDRAVEMFRMSIEVDPDTTLAGNARQTIPRAETAAWIRKPWYLATTLNWGYDDNVPRDPLGEITGRPLGLPSGSGDQFQTFYLRGGYKFINQKDLEAGLGYSMFSIGYREWIDSNVTSQSPHLYVQYSHDPVILRFQYDFSYFYAGGKDQGINPPIYLTFANNSEARLRMHSFIPTITFLEPYDLRTDINLSYQIKDYLDGVTGDASRYGGNITQSYKIPNTRCYPRIGYRYAYEPSDDKRSTYRYHEVFVGVSSHIYRGVWGDLSFGYMRTRYPDFSSERDRLDGTCTTSVTLNRNFFRSLLLSFTYLHFHNSSDFDESGEDLYSFKKNVYLLSCTYTF